MITVLNEVTSDVRVFKLENDKYHIIKRTFQCVSVFQ